MPRFSTKQIIFAVVAILVVVGIFAFLALKKEEPVQTPVDVPVTVAEPVVKIIGKSVEGRDIESYTYGSGEKHVAFVGGIHGGYEWNSVLLAYEFIDHLKANPDELGADLKVTIIPSANPDGLFDVIGKEGRFAMTDVPPSGSVPVGTGRFNARGVDLNRNFDCKWKPESTWRSQKVSAGVAPFSEPEAQAIQAFVLENKPDAVVFWHSQADAVYASECESGILPGTLAIMNAYAGATGYKAVDTFDAYEVTGDAEGWLASIGIPAITVELKTHEAVEWDRNLAGIKAMFAYYEGQTRLGL